MMGRWPSLPWGGAAQHDRCRTWAGPVLIPGAKASSRRRRAPIQPGWTDNWTVPRGVFAPAGPMRAWTGVGLRGGVSGGGGMVDRGTGAGAGPTGSADSCTRCGACSCSVGSLPRIGGDPTPQTGATSQPVPSGARRREREPRRTRGPAAPWPRQRERHASQAPRGIRVASCLPVPSRMCGPPPPAFRPGRDARLHRAT